MTAQQYNADSIEVLTGLEPVQRRPGMYTDTSRPNHLGQEVIDNSVDEALAGHADAVQVILHDDQSLEVIDNGRGMPVDIHPEEGVTFKIIYSFDDREVVLRALYVAVAPAGDD